MAAPRGLPVVLVARVALAALVAGAGCAAAKGSSASASASVPAPPRASEPKTMTVAEIAARALPAVVTIKTAQSLGTGFVVRQDGWIATNLHVIVGGPRVKVVLRDERELDVIEVLAASPEYDLALVRVDARGLRTVLLGDSDVMRPGDPVVAIGNPLGLVDTVSDGLVSARRKLKGLEVLQVSAPIAPGSSGGPIFNDRGEVIGIATAVMQGGQNLNFGVPIRYLAPMIRKPAPMPISEFATLFAQLRSGRSGHVERNVPHHPLSILDGCSIASQKLLVESIEEAIEAGAPLYNDGNPGACYHMYDGAASDLVRKLPASCRGPARALGEAQRRAAGLADAGAQAWALRDAFDGMLEVIARKHGQ